MLPCSLCSEIQLKLPMSHAVSFHLMGSESKGGERKATILRVGKRKNYGADPITRGRDTRKATDSLGVSSDDRAAHFAMMSP